MEFRKLGVLTVAAAMAVTACSGGGSSPSASSSGGGGGGTAVKIGVDLPLSGGEAPNGQPTLNGIKLAVQQIKVPGYSVTLSVQDDAVNGKHDPQQGATNVTTLVNDSSVIGVVGPYNSNVGAAEIPITNAAGLLQCSPANTNPGLTKPAFGGLDLRSANPTKIAYVRVATTDDIQGQAGADIAYNVVKAKNVFVIDDTETYGKALADQFVKSFTALGGTVIDGASHGVGASQQGDFTALLTQAKAANPDYIFFGGVTTTGGGLLRKQMVTQGMGNIPFGGGDGIVDGNAATSGSFLNLAGPTGDMNTYGTVAAIHDIPNPTKFANDYQAAFGSAPGSYSAPAYACTQIILAALKAVGNDREKIRAYVTDTSNKFDTVLGTISFDANGDTSQHIISYYKFDPSTKDWSFFEQKDFGSSGS
jgi:branched-chain amino acid transport system substrate-binding protein